MLEILLFFSKISGENGLNPARTGCDPMSHRIAMCTKPDCRPGVLGGQKQGLLLDEASPSISLCVCTAFEVARSPGRTSVPSNALQQGCPKL